MFNEYELKEEYVVFKVRDKNNNIYEVKFDIDDLSKLKEFNLCWQVTWSGTANCWYIHSTKYIGKINGKDKYQGTYLHRFVMNAQKGEYVHHKNHDTFDNRKSNLEITTNSRNLKIRSDANKNSLTGYRNIMRLTVKGKNKTTIKYIVGFQVNGKCETFGRYNNLDDAVKKAEEIRPTIEGYT